MITYNSKIHTCKKNVLYYDENVTSEPFILYKQMFTCNSIYIVLPKKVNDEIKIENFFVCCFVWPDQTQSNQVLLIGTSLTRTWFECLVPLRVY